MIGRTLCASGPARGAQVYALRPDKQRAVATETLQVWCSLAERLGMFALKARGPPLSLTPRARAPPFPAACGAAGHVSRSRCAPWRGRRSPLSPQPADASV